MKWMLSCLKFPYKCCIHIYKTEENNKILGNHLSHHEDDLDPSLYRMEGKMDLIIRHFNIKE